MPRGFPLAGKPAGNAVKRFFPGMERACEKHGPYTVTEGMNRRKSYSCPKCRSESTANYKRANPEKKREWEDTYIARNPGKRGQYGAAYKARYPEKAAARQAVQSAVRNGTLKRMPCEVCGAAKAHAHHDDYSKPLEVKWLCHTHHMEVHWKQETPAQ